MRPSGYRDHSLLASRAKGAIPALVLMVVAVAASGIAAEAQSARDKLADSKQRVRQKAQQLDDLVARYEEMWDRLAAARSDLQRTEKAARGIAKRLLENKEAAVRTARRLYQAGSNLDLQMLMSTDDLSQIEGRLHYVQSAHKAYLSVFERLRVDSRLLDAKLAELERKHASIGRQFSHLVTLRERLETELARERARVAKLTDEVAAREAAAPSPPPPPPPEPPEPPEPPQPVYSANWDAIAQCESSGRWHLDAYYDGGLQFHPDTWIAFGGGKYAAYAWQASRLEQIAIAEKVLAAQGPGAWPNCFVPA
jgi:predicted  nucleic acid-binding Zn-ribbon protein